MPWVFGFVSEGNVICSNLQIINIAVIISKRRRNQSVVILI